MLAGIYTHTNGYTVAAPMSHYLGLNGSRFHYSHDNYSVPVHGLENLLLDEDMVMTFQTQEGKQIPHHKAMDYIYRPSEFENMSPITFFSEVERVSARTDQTDGDETFQFREGYPLRKTFVCKKQN